MKGAAMDIKRVDHYSIRTPDPLRRLSPRLPENSQYLWTKIF